MSRDKSRLLPPQIARWRVPALAAAALLGAPVAWGACTDTATQGRASSNSVCTATQGTYVNRADALLATSGGTLTVGQSVTFTTGSSIGPMDYAHIRADGDDSLIHFKGDVSVPQAGVVETAALMAMDGGQIRVDGATRVDLQAGPGIHRMGVFSDETGSLIALGAVSVVSSGANQTRGLVAEHGGKLSYRSANIDFRGRNYAIGIRQTHPNGDVIGGDTAIQISGPNSWGVQVFGPIHINGALNLDSADGIGLRFFNTGQIHLGAGAQIRGTSGAAVSIRGQHAAPLVAAAGLQIHYTDPGSIAFDVRNAAPARTDLAHAAVAAETLWQATGGNYTFNAQGGAYTGKAAGNARFTLNMSAAAKWKLNADSALGRMELTGDAVLSLDSSHTLTASHADGVKNTGGVIDLKDATPATGDVLTIAGNYAGGGKLRLDVNLASGGNHGIGADADALLVNGNVTGSTQIEVTALPGAGIATSGNGILVARVTGTAPATAFTLPAPVVSGGFQYTLHQVGNEWFLKSSAYVAPGVAPVPALSHLGLLLTGGLLAGAAARARRGRKQA